MYNKIYLIDSENIGDEWVNILDVMENNDCIFAFYTDRSTHMNCNQVSKLMESGRGRVQWIKCFEGNNALDFQLVSELGAMIGRDEAMDYVIVSRDNGYNPVVRYWKQRGIAVSKQNGPEKSVPTEEMRPAEEQKRSEKAKKPEEEERFGESENKKEEKKPVLSEKDRFFLEFSKAVDVTDHVLCYAALVAFEGQKKGAEDYRRLKSMDREQKAMLSELRLEDKRQRKIRYIELLLEKNNLGKNYAAGLCDMMEKPDGDKNTYYRELIAKYGQEEGLNLFRLTKSHYNNIRRL